MKLKIPFRRDRVEQRGQMTIVEHLEELRHRIIVCLLAVAVGAVAGFLLWHQIIELLVDPYCETLERVGRETATGECALIFNDLIEPFTTRVRVGVYAGLFLAMPVLLWQVWRFVTPALHPHEKRWAIPFVVSAGVLFVLGAGLAYWTFPRAIEFLLEVAGDQVQPLLSIGPYLKFITFMMLTFGIGFEFPILLVFLQMAGIIEPRQLGAFRRYAIVLIVAGVAIITPSGDPISLAALSVPMYVFYEASAVIGRLILRRRRRTAA